MRCLLNKRVIIVLFVFIVPVIITMYLYPFDGEILVSDSTTYQQHEFVIDNVFKKDLTFKNFIAGIVSVPLSLDWYKVSIVNNSRMINADCSSGDDLVRTFFTFVKGDPRTYFSTLKESTEETGGYGGTPGHPVYYLEGNGDSGYFLAKSSEEYSINGGLIIVNNNTPCYKDFGSEDFHLGDLVFDYSIKVTPTIESWLARLFVIFIFWIFVVSSSVSILDWIRRNK